MTKYNKPNEQNYIEVVRGRNGHRNYISLLVTEF
jgi:hypothetical protein